MAIGRDIIPLSETLDYAFSDLSLLEVALTHSSFANEAKSRGMNFSSNERMEFLGDAVLQILISEYLFAKNASSDEGVLSRIRQNLVCESSLAAAASRLNLGAYLNLGVGEEKNRQNPAHLAKALEAVIAAVWLDSAGNRETVWRVVLKILSVEIGKYEKTPLLDPKTRLQQLADADAALLEYVLESESGPGHQKTFTVVAKINNNVVGRGTGSRIRSAEMEAAKEALTLFGKENPTEH